MKNLRDYENDIVKCSKCALCQSVCPVFKLTKNECAVSKGKFVMLDGVIKGKLKLSKTINKYLDMCSKCGKCKEFCPSGIDIVKIFNCAKYDYAKNNLFSKIIFALQSEFLFDNLLNLFQSFNKLFLLKYSNNNKSYSVQNALYFKGCSNKVFPRNEVALKKIFNQLRINLKDENFTCCGVPFLSSGNLERYERAKNTNLRIIQNREHDFIITDCASCEDSLKDYDENINVVNIVEFLIKQDKKFVFKKPLRVTFHKPCHMKNYENIKKLFGMCENIEYIEMKDYDECCGFSGEFALNNPKIAKQLMKTKAENALSTGADVILTMCPACVIGLNTGLLLNRKKAKVMNIVEFISQSEIL